MAACLTEAGKRDYKNTHLGAVTDALRGAGIMGPMAGAAAGKLIDDWLTDEDESMPFLWAAGALLGTRQVRGRVKGFVSSKDTPRLPNSPDRDLDQPLREAMDGEQVGSAARLTNNTLSTKDTRDMTILESLNTTIKSMAGSNRPAFELIRNSMAMKSTLSFLKALPQTPQVKRFTEYVQNMDGFVRGKNARSKAAFNNQYGKRSYDTYHDTELPQLIDSIRPESLQERNIEALRDDVLSIVQKGNVRIEEGRLVIDDFGDILDVVDNTPGLRRVLETLVADQKFVDFARSSKVALKDFSDEWVQILNRQTDAARAVTLPQNRGLLDDFLSRNVVSSVFKDMSAEKGVSKHFDDAMKWDEGFKRAVEYRELTFRFQDPNYWPQIFSRSKFAELTSQIERSAIERNPDIQGNIKALAAATNEELFQQLYRANQNNTRIKNRLLFYDEQSKAPQERRFAALTEARRVFTSTIRASDMSDAQKETIVNNIDRYIRSFDAQKMDGTTQKMYRIHMDDDAIAGLGFNPMAKMNEQALRKGVTAYINGTTVANSNYLDLPRIFELPMRWTETNVNKQLATYYNDAGRRMYNAVNDIFDEAELMRNYISPIRQTIKEAYVDNEPMEQLAERRIRSAYALANNTYGKTGGEVAQQQRNQKLADMTTFGFFTRYMVSISGYNFFEPLVVGPLITGVRSFANTFTGAWSRAGREQIESVEQYLLDQNILTNQLRSVSPGMDVMDATHNPHRLLDQAHYTANNIAGKLSNFAAIGDATRWLTGGRVDVERGGVARMGFGSFMSSNRWNTAMIVKSAFDEVNNLSRIYNQLKVLPEGQRNLQVNGRNYTMGDVQRRMEMFGISERHIDDFAERNEAYRNALDVVYDKSRTLNDVDETLSDYLRQIAQHTVDNFHGTSKAGRPDLWHTPSGRVLSMYSSYANNFGLQNLQRRIRFPLRDWNANHGERMNIKGTSLEHLYHFKRGNFDKLRELGFDNAAIDDFPIEAYAHITKLMMAMGVSVGGFLTRSVIDDIIAYPLNDRREQEQWVRTRRSLTVNPLAPPEHRKTWGDLQDDFEVVDALNVVMGGLGLAAQGAAFGRYSDIISSNYFIRRDGIMALTPVTSEVNQMFKSFAGMVQTAGTSPGDLPNEIGRTMIDTGVSWLPYVGAWPFSGFTNAALQWEQQQGRVRGAEMNGISININDISL